MVKQVSSLFLSHCLSVLLSFDFSCLRKEKCGFLMSVLLWVVPSSFSYVMWCSVLSCNLFSSLLSLSVIFLCFSLFKTGWLRMYNVSVPMPRAVLLSTFRDFYTCQRTHRGNAAGHVLALIYSFLVCFTAQLLHFNCVFLVLAFQSFLFILPLFILVLDTVLHFEWSFFVHLSVLSVVLVLFCHE